MTKTEPAVRARTRWPAWLSVLLCLAIGGCYSSDYRHQAAATASMLGGLADKLGDYCRANFKLDRRTVSSEEMGEFYYALKKGRSFASEATGNSARRSYRDLNRLLDDYAAFLSDADQYRLAGKPDPARLTELLIKREQVVREAQAVIADARNRD